MKKIIAISILLFNFNLKVQVKASEVINGMQDKINNIIRYIRFKGEDEFLIEENSGIVESIYNYYKYIDCDNR
ncbi:hypothetical protein PMY56_01975 [Clostridium tertium]|uniref:hypothetical protein n=1 Tax=Clostridium tertium TaxID=1559 RepID=UPI00232AEA75|nr:hypothetical protein [Clostridium tertium]MDB1921697.1 hypothetical protein [Clostridium tertium]MDB1924900.1 hypothetical protein [Clostridium tertium]MDB1929539.1 hypothetical protein [Clostridium tertium]